MTVLTPDLLDSFDASITDVATAVTLPAVVYTDEEFLAFLRTTHRSRQARETCRAGERERLERRFLEIDAEVASIRAEVALHARQAVEALGLDGSGIRPLRPTSGVPPAQRSATVERTGRERLVRYFDVPIRVR